MSPEQKTMLRAVRDTMAEHIKSIPRVTVTNEVPTPRVTVTNEVGAPPVNITNDIKTPEVTVDVDMEPVAEAVDRMSEMLASAIQVLLRQQAEMAVAVRALAEALASLPATPVQVEAPAVAVHVPPREKRRLVVKHGDGSETVIEEV